MSLEPDYSLADVVKAIGMSERWVRQKCADGAEHLRYGRKIRFTSEQVAKLRADHTRVAPVQSITTGRKRQRAG